MPAFETLAITDGAVVCRAKRELAGCQGRSPQLAADRCVALWSRTSPGNLRAPTLLRPRRSSEPGVLSEVCIHLSDTTQLHGLPCPKLCSQISDMIGLKRLILERVGHPTGGRRGQRFQTTEIATFVHQTP